MLGKRLFEILKRVDVIALAVPTAILVISAIFPLRPITRQLLVAVLLVWFGVEAMTGFSFWS